MKQCWVSKTAYLILYDCAENICELAQNNSEWATEITFGFVKYEKHQLELKGLRSTQHWVGAEKQLCLGLPGLDMPLCLTHSPPALVLLFPESKREAIICVDAIALTQTAQMARNEKHSGDGRLNGVPEVWWDMAHPPTGLAWVSSCLWACRPPEKHLPTENVLWHSSCFVCTHTNTRRALSVLCW